MENEAATAVQLAKDGALGPVGPGGGKPGGPSKPPKEVVEGTTTCFGMFMGYVSPVRQLVRCPGDPN